MVTELRVHGVSGSPAERMLDRPLLDQVAGDRDAGFFRPHPAYPSSPGPGGALLEAYRWGGLTARAAARALWLLLLPFMLSNVTMWLRPAGGRATRTIRALARIFALTMTATFVLAMVGISLDLVGWQCTDPGSRCAQDRPYLSWLTDLEVGQRLAVTAAVPLAALGLLWFLARRTWSRYEGYETPPTGLGDGLAHPCFWNGKPLVGRLRAIHLATGFGVIAAVLLGVLVPRHRDTAGFVLAAATVALLLACVLVLCLSQFIHRDDPARWAEGTAITLRTVGQSLMVATIGYAVWPRDPWATEGALPGYGMTATTLFAAQAALLVVLGVVCFAVRQRPARLLGLAAPIVGSLGLGVAVAFSAGLSYRVADFLDRDAKPSEPEQVPHVAMSTLDPPASFEWAALGFVLLVLVVAIVALIGRMSVVRRLRRAAIAVTDKDFAGRRAGDKARAGVIDTAIARARLTDHIGPLLALAYIPLSIVAMVVTGMALAGTRPVGLTPSGSVTERVVAGTVTIGTYLIGLAALGLVVVGLLAYRYQGVRRVVGVAWDLGTFWPRAAHPLAPPCYAERVVPELVTRASFLAGNGGVVLSGHSQGSVLAAATVLQLPAPALRTTALVTYGSPLNRLYATYFPAYVDSAVLTRVGESLSGSEVARVGGAALAAADPTPRWINLWRDTDPIGRPVGTGATDIRMVDPSGWDIPAGDTIHPPVAGHSGYSVTPTFVDVVAGLVARVGQLGAPLPRDAPDGGDGAVPPGPGPGPDGGATAVAAGPAGAPTP